MRSADAIQPATAAMRRLDVICPVYREEQVIELFHERLTRSLAPLRSRYDARLIYVVDPSPDRTEQILRKLTETNDSIVVLVMSRRFGHQAALIAGLDASQADAVIMLDSDLQHPPELIPELVAKWEDGAEVVQAIRQDGSSTGYLKRVTSRSFYRLILSISSVELQNGAADYRLLSNRVVQVFRTQIREHNPFLRGLVSWVGYEIAYVPFVPAARALGKSKYRPSTLISFALNGICSFSKFPLRLCITAGLLAAALSFLLAVIQVVVYLSSDISVPGWASVFSVVTFTAGVQLFFLGVIGEYISLIFDEVKGRPRFLVRSVYHAGVPADDFGQPLHDRGYTSSSYINRPL